MLRDVITRAQIDSGIEWRGEWADGTCYVVFTAVGQLGPRIGIAKTEDFVKFLH